MSSAADAASAKVALFPLMFKLLLQVLSTPDFEGIISEYRCCNWVHYPSYSRRNSPKQSSCQKKKKEKTVDFSDQTNANIDNKSYQFVTAFSMVRGLPVEEQ